MTGWERERMLDDTADDAALDAYDLVCDECGTIYTGGYADSEECPVCHEGQLQPLEA